MMWKEGDPILLHTHFEKDLKYIAMCRDEDAPCTLHRERSGWKVVRIRQSIELAFTRFARTEVGWSCEDANVVIDISDIEQLKWPHYRDCSGYMPIMEASKDYLLRALELGREPATVARVRRLLPAIVVNHVRSGKAELALERLSAEGLGFLRPFKS